MLSLYNVNTNLCILIYVIEYMKYANKIDNLGADRRPTICMPLPLRFANPLTETRALLEKILEP